MHKPAEYLFPVTDPEETCILLRRKHMHLATLQQSAPREYQVIP